VSRKKETRDIRVLASCIKDSTVHKHNSISSANTLH